MSFTAHWALGSATAPLPSTAEVHSLTPSCSEFSAHDAISPLCFAPPALAEIPSSARLTRKAQCGCVNFTSPEELMYTLIALITLHFHDVSFSSPPRDG